MADGNWHCASCGAKDGFVCTMTRVLHVTNRHVAPARNGLDEQVQYDPKTKSWG